MYLKNKFFMLYKMDEVYEWSSLNKIEMKFIERGHDIYSNSRI